MPPNSIENAFPSLIKTAKGTAYWAHVSSLAGPLCAKVDLIYPGHMKLVYLVTELRRRQVINAFLSRVAVRPEKIDQIREDLQYKSSRHLIEMAFGVAPKAFIGVLARLGDRAQAPMIYQTLFDVCHESPMLAGKLARGPKLDADLIRCLGILPTDYRSIPLAEKLLSCGRDFVHMIELIGADHPLAEKLRLLAIRGSDWSPVLREIYMALPFPEPVVPTNDILRHLKNGNDMAMAAESYQNCLTSYVPKAMRGEYQFYEWLGETKFIVALTRHRRGWQITEIKGHRNQSPSRDDSLKIQTYFADNGIHDISDELPILLEKFMIGECGFGLFTNERDLTESQVDLEWALHLA